MTMSLERKCLQKITKTREYKRIKAIAQKIYSKNILLQTAAARETVGVDGEACASSHVMRYGITVTKALGGASVRNKIKRRLRMLIRAELPHYGACNQEYVFIARHGAAHCSYGELERDVRIALKKLSG